MRIRVNNVDLYYETLGAGAPLIMLHGNREDHTIFDRASALLKNHYTLYLIDSRCHGESEDTKDLTYNLLSDDVIAFTETLNLYKPVLFGFSDGAIATLYAAAKRPDLFKSIIVCGANTYPKGLNRVTYRGLKIKTLFDRDKYDMLMLKGPNIKKEDLERISIPALVIAGEKDVVKKNDTLFIARNIKNSKLMILDGEDHGSYIIHSDKIAKIILANK